MRALWLFPLVVACSDGSTFKTLNNSAGLGGNQKGDDAESEGDSGDQVGVTDTEDGGSDAPVWVNGSYLTCAWSEALSDTEAALGCTAHKSSGDAIVAEADARWSAAMLDGTELQTASNALGETMTARLVLSAVLLPDVTVSVAMSGGDLSAPLVEVLPGFDDPADLASCLRGGGALTTCLESVGIFMGTTPGPVLPPDPTPPTPPRTVNNGFTYYLGGAGQSCDEVCSPFGGTTDASIDVTGSSGTALNCVDVLADFGIVSVYDGRTAAEGIGCYIAANGAGERVSALATTHAARAAGVRRVCSCQQ